MAPKRKQEVSFRAQNYESSSKKPKENNISSLPNSIINCFRRQQQDEARNVTCPVCGSLVLYKNINEHLDKGCHKPDFDLFSVQDSETIICKPEKFKGELADKDIPNSANEKSITPYKNKAIPKLLKKEKKISDVDTVEENSFVGSKDEYSSKVLLNNYNVNSNNTSDEARSELESNDGEISTYGPYYLQNFLLTIDTVMQQEDDKKLFNESDNAVVETFRALTDKAKMLYVRLFQRKYFWFKVDKIQYPRISDDLSLYFEELIKTGFLQTEVELVDLAEILHLLPANDVQELAKAFHISYKSKSKKKLVVALLTLSSRQCSLFSNNGNKIAQAIVKRAKLLLGLCVKLESTKRNVFSRVILLFTLNLLADDDDNYRSQLSNLFLINVGKVVYPSYQISRNTAIFLDRNDVISYDLANQDSCHMDDAIESKNFDGAREIFMRVHVQYVEALERLANEDIHLVHSSNLPVHLRRFTSVYLYTKMCSKGVDLLQRNKQYLEAVALLRELLSQQVFCGNYRGWWWERLALNLDQHLKKPAEALVAIREGLADGRVKTGHRLALEQRAKKICETKSNASLKKHMVEITFTELRQPKVITISGRRLSDEPVFVLYEVNSNGSVNNEVLSYCGVEEMALRYYRQQGFNQGLHGEGATFNTLFTLLMWDVIFRSCVSDVFRTPFQAAPLDIYCENFYENRKEMIDERLEEIRNASSKQITKWIESTWLEQEGTTCVGVSWDLFSGVEQIMELARCIGSVVIAGICEKFAKNYRHTRSGLPDLVVWNSDTLEYKIIEVKGPNDRLSSKQHVWLDVLVSLGVDAEVLYVKAVGGKKL